MNLLDELKELGVDVEEGLERVVGDEPLYKVMLGMFIDTVNANHIELADFEADNLESLTERVHAMKGLTGNLAMTPLFTGYLQALDFLRTNRPAEAKEAYEKLLPAQKAVMECIGRHTDDVE